jgi:P4 family phage/plasmid primase-like protien
MSTNHITPPVVISAPSMPVSEAAGKYPTTERFSTRNRESSAEINSLKSHHSVPRLFGKLVRDLRDHGSGYTGRCPHHRDETASFSVYQDGDGTWLYKCFACNSAGNVFQFLEWLNGTPFAEAVREVKAFLGVTTGGKPSPTGGEEKPPYKYDKAATMARLSEGEDYLTRHGVSPEVARRHDVGVDDYPGVGKCIAFPYDDRNVKLRALGTKTFLHYKGTSTANLFYNLRVLDRFEFLLRPEVFITESERDCLTLVSHGFNAISVSSATACLGSDGTLKFGSHALEKLRQVEQIYLALDQDESGHSCAVALQRALPQARILSWEYHGKDSGDLKDIGEIYKSDPANFKVRIQQLCASAPESIVEVGDEPFVEHQPDIAESVETEDIESLPEVLSEDGYPLTDAGNAERLVAEHGENIRYLNDHRQWTIWDGTRWNVDKTSEIYRRAKETIRKIGFGAFQPDERDKDKRKDLTKWSFGCEARSRLDNMVILAAREAKVSTNASAFDQSPWLFNCVNGTLDLESNTFRSARREDLLSKRSPVVYDPKATCLRFDDFLGEILPSPDIRRFLQSSLGYTLSGHAWEKLIWFLIGESGDNGKTTFIEAIRAVFGVDDYATNMNFNSLMPREGQGPSGDIARLRGIRFASASESDQGQRLSTAQVKRQTGGDRLTAAFKFKDEFEFDPTHKIWLATNYPPTISCEDDAIWNRIARVPFDVRVPVERQDHCLGEKLKLEGPGILNWMFAGWKIYREEGLKPPQEIRVATETYRDDQDVVKEFLKERVLEGSEDIGSTKLYLAFKGWFTSTHNKQQQPMAQKKFSTRLQKLGKKIDPRRDGSYICNVGQLITGRSEDAEIPF